MRFVLVMVIFLLSCEKKENITFDTIYQFKNILNIKNIPSAAKDGKASAFFDQGSWHAFALSPDDESPFYGGFVGPFLMTDWRWTSQQLSRIYLIDEVSGKELNLKKATLVRNDYLAGKLIHELLIDDIHIQLTLIFMNDKSALIQSVITNQASDSRDLKLGWTGELIDKSSYIKNDLNHLKIVNSEQADFMTIHHEDFENYIIKHDSTSYRMEKKLAITIPSGQAFKTNQMISRFDNDEQLEGTDIDVRFKRSDIYLEENKIRWLDYLRPILSSETKWAKEKKYQEIAVKSVFTLMNNWKGPRGALKYAGIIPSYNIHYFDGFWAWDSWKHSAALAHFNPELAKDQILTMYFRQNNVGMIPDCIFANPDLDNWRDTKPPLSAWAVYEIVKVKADDSFLNNIYSKVKRYHEWWYDERDHDKNGLCEYGSTDGTIIAAKWESGMDNAVRFDHVKMHKNSYNAHSLNLESVDLNAYLYAEKIYLSKLAKMINEHEDAEKFKADAEILKEKINSAFFNQDKGYFFDKKLAVDTLIDDAGPEGWIPLWSESASEENAELTIKFMQNPETFSTFIPFPTVSKSNPEFSLGYWRGTVWLDQVYFAIKGIRNYGKHDLADEYTKQIFDRLEGLSQSDLPIMENYNPENGDRLNVNHFSWSAAHLLLLYLDK